ncbi:MAG: OmpA family protein [Bacteroidota bacterium]
MRLRTVVFVFSFLLPFVVTAQKTFWINLFGGEGFDMGQKVIPQSDGTLVIAGTLYSADGFGSGNHSQNADVVVFSYATQGVVFWKKTLGGKGSDELADFIQTKDGGFALVGTSDSQDGDVNGRNPYTNIWVAKLSAMGELEWSKTFGGPGSERGKTICETADGGLLVGGTSGSKGGNMRSEHHGGLDSWVAKLDSDGKIIWERHFGGSQNEEVAAMLPINDKEYLVVSSSTSFDGQVTQSLGKKDIWVKALDEYGKIIWQTNFGGEHNDDIHGICRDAAGNFVLVGTSFSTTGFVYGHKGQGDLWVIKINPQGGMIWSRTYGGRKGDGGNSIVAASDGGYVVCGMTKSGKPTESDGDIPLNAGYYDGFVVKIGPNGSTQWARTFGLEGKDSFLGIAEAPKGGYLAIGFLEQKKDAAPIPGHNGSYDLWLVNFSDPLKRNVRAHLTPPALSGTVISGDTGSPLAAQITLTDNVTLDSIIGTRSLPDDGFFRMLLPAYGLVSINVLAKGFLFYGEDLLMDSVINLTKLYRRVKLEPIRVGSSLILDNIYFNPGKWELLPASRAELERLVSFLKLNPKVRILISGHTDNTGNKSQKVKLSEYRALAVKKYLEQQGIPAFRMQTKGYGMYRPIASNRTSAGRKRNRRVEFEVTVK